MKKICIIVLCVVIALSFTACKKSDPGTAQPGNVEPDKIEKTMEGTVEGVTEQDGTITLIVKAQEQTNSQYDEAAVLVTKDTSLSEIGEAFQGDATSFPEGTVVRVYTDGTASDSAPPQLTAVLIEIVK